MFTKKIQRQETESTMSPPMTGPKIGPSSVGTPMTAITRPSRCGPAVWASALMPSSMIMPPPKPCSTRRKIREPADLARPHSVDPSPNSATETIHTRLAAKRSDIHPVRGITTARASM
jgi:hypothetical protein